MNYLITALIGLVTLGGGAYFAPRDFPPFEHDSPLCQIFPSSRLCADFNLGAVSYPSSLDVFENPGASASVATVVTHSTQHGNANDALEALEAKLGIGASTPITGSILAGSGTGSSGWTTYATTTNLQSTNILATGSSTLQNFTFVYATGTSATTTNFFATTASTTNLWGTNINGFNLTTCETTNALTWSSGKFGCVAISTNAPTVLSTTTVQQLATTTFSIAAGTLPNTNNWKFTFQSPNISGSASTTATLQMKFNNDSSLTYSYSVLNNATNQATANAEGVLIASSLGAGVVQAQSFIGVEILNNSIGFAKTGTFEILRFSTTTAHSTQTSRRGGLFYWENTSPITQVDFAYSNSDAFFGTSTVIHVMGW